MRAVSGFKNFEQATFHPWFSTALTLLRLGMGCLFFFAGVSKLQGWSASAYLESATGPFAEVFSSMAGSVLVDQLNIWGLILIGACLILGVFVRPASFFGVVLMLLYYFAQFEQNIVHGYIDYHLMYACIFILFLAGGVGHVFGMDGWLYRQMRRSSFLRSLLFG